ncbi:hypothetical protein TNIN_238041 [Trichonephila inaurata madagascariensis]|uniref:RNase H type-1 domain-containing protein n=1 Tax=Trichonephila inaurata madagascariensis TaxID=2747483 RepID=A0A8X6XIR5_9ARAC|nr:hypothetical protein TNIN_238041 [Trichonephila inaurata madagascariensis]
MPIPLWNDSLPYTKRNFKSQGGFLQKIMALKVLHNFRFEPEDLLKTSCQSEKTAFNADIAALRIVLSEFLSHTDLISKVAILSDSREKIQAISSYEAPISVDILKCQLLISDLLQGHIDIAKQWIQSHCGIDGNKNDDCLAKGTQIIQISNNIVPKES